MSESLIKSIETSDYEEFSAQQEGWDACYRPLKVEAFAARMKVARIGGIQVDLDSYKGGLEITATSPKDAIGIGVPFDGAASYISQGVEISKQSIDVYGSAREIHAVTKPGSSLLTCCIDKGAIYGLPDSPMLSVIRNHLHGRGVIQADRRTVDDMRRCCARFINLCCAKEIPEKARTRIVDETLLVICAALNAAGKQYSVEHGARYQVARRARDFMMDHQSDPPSISEICNFLRISPRSLNNVFHDTYAVSPKRFLKALRLSAAHYALKCATREERVSDIALNFGFWDFGHFAKDYRTMFGETPSATLRR